MASTLLSDFMVTLFCYNFLVVTIDFGERQFTGSESSGIVEVVVVKVGGTSSAPLDVIVTPSEQSPPSATGKEYFGRYDV